jgi:hypothetical protein
MRVIAAASKPLLACLCVDFFLSLCERLKRRATYSELTIEARSEVLANFVLYAHLRVNTDHKGDSHVFEELPYRRRVAGADNNDEDLLLFEEPPDLVLGDRIQNTYLVLFRRAFECQRKAILVFTMLHLSVAADVKYQWLS